jgi:hypothetical protein
MNRRTKLAIFIPLGIVGFALFIAIGGEVVKLLWNWLTPTLFGWRQINFLQALGLLVLCRILFGGLGGGGGSRSRAWRRRRMAERCEQMTREERERLAEKLHGRWGDVPPSDSKPNA